MALVQARRLLALARDKSRTLRVAADRSRAHNGDGSELSLAASAGSAPHARPQRLTERERQWVWLTDVPFGICAIAALVWLPALRPFDPLVCLLLIAGFAAASRIRIPLRGFGWAPAVQLVFVPMLFFAPLNLVPLMVVAGCLVDELPSYVTRRQRTHREVLALGDSWYALGPVAVLAAAGEADFAWEHWPIYAAAFGAQLAVNLLLGYPRAALHTGGRPAFDDVVTVPTIIDVTLTLPALCAVGAAQDAPVAAALSLVALLAITRGVSSERSGRLVARHLATHDLLTGLPNRLLFGELAQTAIKRARREGRPSGLLLIDLNEFKAVNDDRGHLAGDRVLVEAARRLRAAVRAADTVARFGGDEFAVLLDGHQTTDSCAMVAAKLRDAFSAPIALAPGRRPISIAVGAALVLGDDPLEGVLDAADAAMYADKQRHHEWLARGGGPQGPTDPTD